MTTTTETPTPLELATRYGFAVFPVEHMGKQPMVRWGSEASTDPATITAMFAGRCCNIGVACGPSGIVVIDEDVPGGLARYAASVGATVPATLTVETARGAHYYFRADPSIVLGNGKGLLDGYGCDVRGHGGYVVGPGSVHETGAAYTVANDVDPAPLPEWLVTALTHRTGTTSTTGAAQSADDFLMQRTGIDAVADLIPGPHADGTPGSRHGDLVSYACSLRARNVPLAEAEVLFADVFRRCEQPPVCTTALTWPEARGKLHDCYTRYAAGPSGSARVEPVPPVSASTTTATIDEVHALFTRWLGPEFGLAPLDIVLATAAAEQLDGDPPWLLVVSGSGNAKTELVISLAGAGATITSTITSAGALLSATAKQQRTPDATGGLLRKLGPRGVLCIKDFTSIISMGREVRAEVLAALREVYDGRWERNVGTDGGRSLLWEGRLVVIGATTTAYDTASGVIASMGDRFALVRVDSRTGRMESGRQALRNVGGEIAMRAELAQVVGGLLAQVQPALAVLDSDAEETLLAAADLVTRARSAVERDQRGEVIDAHAPEMPTRFAKMIGQIMRGALALGMPRAHAVNLALRVAHDSVPPMRLAVLIDVAGHAGTTTTEVQGRLQKPRTTVDRTLQELHVLGLVTISPAPTGLQGWRYRVDAKTDVSVLDLLPEP